MNLSAFLIQIAYGAFQRARDNWILEGPTAVIEAIVFAWIAVEALLNEQAHVEIYDFGHGSEVVYNALDRGAQGFERVQAVLTYLYGRGLKDGEYPANDLKHLGKLRNGLVHYRWRDPRVVTSLNDLCQRGLLTRPAVPWDQLPLAWTAHAKPELAEWAYHVSCDTGQAVAALMPDDGKHVFEQKNTHENFRRTPLQP